MRAIFYVGMMTVGIVTAFGQGTLVFDQQSSSGTLAGSGSFLQNQQPMGQSFTPSLSAVGFVQLQFVDTTGTQGSTIYVNLLEGSITGGVISATSPVYLPNGFLGVTNFYFSSNIAVQPGIEHYFVPVLQSGDNVAWMGGVLNYLNGKAYFSGQPNNTDVDFYFREGIVVPEPSLGAFGLVSGFSIFVFRKFRKN